MTENDTMVGWEKKSKHYINGYNEGIAARVAGKSEKDNPYYHGAYGYTKEGLSRDGWFAGFNDVSPR